ncbi:hypothetical protein ASE36_13045 [Rhizobium sp. Root274]|uniref:DUF2332 domain-containing protein n=1 Tax=unclassified Rhizobium TaxID=2613769 RepID=UPI0007138EA2|nr:MULTISPECIES: DUF2332 family protein [unclassified Rhizobium]KQW29362.1 hypothetical protein ASC71_13070 [Rhizobium sp. Root1240]KRD29554.1 hypothetical protein ASE36_13045 [Rhizobium sp. Root274]
MTDDRSELIRQSFLRQAKACADLGSPFTARLCTLAAERLTDRTPVGATVLAWPGNPDGTGDALALRLAGTLHALVRSGQDPALAETYPPHAVDDDTLWSAVEAALRRDAAFILDRLKSAPQTNEVRRSSALLPGFLTIAALTGKPLILSEVGASAGLNLQWDRYSYQLGEFRWGNASPVTLAPHWRGPQPPEAEIKVTERAGCDLNPLDPSSEDDRLRLFSYIWADQQDRLDRTAAALEIATESGLKVEKADAIDWLHKRLATPRPGVAHVIYHTIAWQYLPPALKAEGEALIAGAGSRATEAAPLARLQLEADGKPEGAALLLTLWPTGETREIGRADFHGRWVKWVGWEGSAA